MRAADHKAIRAHVNAFPGYPHLRRVAYRNDGTRMELVEVTETSDGYLIGMAMFGEGKESYLHSIFLGSKPAQDDQP